MSVSTVQSKIKRLTDEISKLNKDISSELSKESNKLNEAQRIRKSITNNTSSSALSSKNNQINNCSRAISASKKKQSELMSKLSAKQKQLSREQSSLAKEQLNEQKQLSELWDSERQRQQSAIESLLNQVSPSIGGSQPQNLKKYDFFISHATEDKAEIAEPLYNELTKRGAQVWYDKTELSVGDSIRKSIDKGLAQSRYGIVILTKTYMSKFWTEKELSGLFSKWSGGDEKVILPIWHNISKDDVSSYSPILADLSALKTADYTVAELADKFYDIIR